MKISIVIPASGEGKRLGSEIPKQFLQPGGEPILRRTLSVFDAMEIVAEIAVAVPNGYAEEVRGYKIAKLLHIVEGKATRAESVYAALRALDKNADAVLVHDGVRPFVTSEIIMAVAEAAKEYGAAVACAPVTDTVKVADDSGNIISTPDRSTLWQAQTPQGFTYEIITRAYATAEADGILATATDDSALAERLGISVKIVPSCPKNIKITTATDLELAKVIWGNL
ncbi:MAG: 2-C-methyl-D-erythritol 4-phosphate cytidylyltransferase [Defluviitaleaceae bacterium]|nr:2-C-methyl-D-erythritol 4-phosphate cytidylyltransferase [Defluviitaleaceae bacterium]